MYMFLRLGFPEVDIGILPGATGTQRFPRVAGLQNALDIIPFGHRFGAKEALRFGVLDKVCYACKHILCVLNV